VAGNKDKEEKAKGTRKEETKARKRDRKCGRLKKRRL
jgi:hypothetical protein